MSIKFLCVTLPHMSISPRIVVAIALHQIDDAPDTEASAQRDHEGLENTYRRSKKCHKSYCRDLWTFRPFGYCKSRNKTVSTAPSRRSFP